MTINQPTRSQSWSFKQTIAFIFKISLTIIISFLSLELLLLLFNDVVFRNSFYIYDAELGFKVRPYVTWGDNITNEFGFNDRDYPHQKEPGVYRILVLSDSFNWAGGLHNNYTAMLERKFETEFGDPRVEVINIGYSGTHTGEQLAILKKYGMVYQPDLVVLGFFAGNDFFDASPWRRRIVVGGVPTDIDTRWDSELTLFGQLLVPRSRLYLFLQEQWNTLRYLQTQQQAEDGASDDASLSAQQPGQVDYTEQYLAMEFARMQVANWENESAFKPNIDYVFENLLAMQRFLADQNSQLMVVVYPDEFQIDETLRQAVLKQYQVDDPSVYQWDRPQGLLWQFCTTHGIEFYDMYPTFLEIHQQGEALYLPNDSHWNHQGNELAAQYLFDILIWKAHDYFNN